MNNTFLLSGTIKGQKDGKIYLNYYLNKEGRSVKDSSTIEDGNFTFQGSLSEPMVATLKLSNTRTMDANSTFIFLEPAVMHVSLQKDKFAEAHLTGSTSQKQYEQLRASKQLLSKKYQKQFDLYKLEDTPHKKDSLRKLLAPYYTAENKLDYSFFVKNPKSYVTLFLLQSHRGKLSPDSLQLFFDRLPGSLQNNIIGKQLAESIQQLKSGRVNTKAKNFTATDSKGDTLRLSDYNGKYVLLDFWASWCVPCRKGNPHLIKLFNAYKGKGFDIVGIASDDSTPNLWREAIFKDSLTIWRHVLRGSDREAIEKGKSNDKDISRMFGVLSLPTKILINPQGLIIGRYEGENGNDDLDKKLAAIFQ